jgi:hypothetical protein
MLDPSAPGVRIVAGRKAGGVRWMVRLDPGSAEAYAACVAPLVPFIEAALSPAVVANRVAAVSVDPPEITLEAWRGARERFRRTVRDLAARADAAVMADVRDCYGAIGPRAVRSALERLECPSREVDALLQTLGSFAAAGVRGLPVGPEPSAVLANAVLSLVDERIAAAGWPHVRWVDDVIVFVADASDASSTLATVEEAARELGLGLAAQKTRVLIDPALIRDGGVDRLSGPRPQDGRASG